MIELGLGVYDLDLYDLDPNSEDNGGLNRMIPLIDGYYIEMDAYNYNLMQKFIGKDRKGNEKESTRIIGHCTSLEHALKALLKNEDLNNDARLTVEEYLQLTEERLRAVDHTISKLADKMEQFVSE